MDGVVHTSIAEIAEGGAPAAAGGCASACISEPRSETTDAPMLEVTPQSRMALLDTGSSIGLAGGDLANILPLKDTEAGKDTKIHTVGMHKARMVTTVHMYALTVTGADGTKLDLLANLVKPHPEEIWKQPNTMPIVSPL